MFSVFTVLILIWLVGIILAFMFFVGIGDSTRKEEELMIRFKEEEKEIKKD